MDEVIQHDDACGIFFETSCAKCQAAWIESGSLPGEVTKAARERLMKRDFRSPAEAELETRKHLKRKAGA